MDVLFDNREIFKIKRQELREDVVVIAAEVDDLRVFFLEFFQYDADEARVGFGPTAPALELPAVDDVAVEDEFFAAHVTEKMVHLGGFTFAGAEVDVGEDNGTDAELVHGS